MVCTNSLYLQVQCFYSIRSISLPIYRSNDYHNLKSLFLLYFIFFTTVSTLPGFCSCCLVVVNVFDFWFALLEDALVSLSPWDSFRFLFTSLMSFLKRNEYNNALLENTFWNIYSYKNIFVSISNRYDFLTDISTVPVPVHICSVNRISKPISVQIRVICFQCYIQIKFHATVLGYTIPQIWESIQIGLERKSTE